MAGFTKIEVHFGDPANPRTIVVRPNKGVQALFLNRSENALGIVKSFPPHLTKTVPEGLTLESATASASDNGDTGPDDVCYLVKGVLHCWAPE
jgi:hypothetical protein